MKKLKLFWESLDDMTTVSKRELFLGIVCCALGGIVLGAICSPKKMTIIGSNNGNGRLDTYEDEQPKD